MDEEMYEEIFALLDALLAAARKGNDGRCRFLMENILCVHPEQLKSFNKVLLRTKRLIVSLTLI